jgi:xanthine dehydrogenase accessory factor
MHFADELVGGVGLPCGGEITVWVEPMDEPLAEFLELSRRGEAATLITRMVDGRLPVSRQLLGPGDAVEPGGPESTEPSSGLNDPGALEEFAGPAGPDVFIDVALPAPKLILIGAVAVAVELSAIAAVAGWRTFIADPRSRFATADRFPAAEQVVATWPQAAFQRWSPLGVDAAVAVLSHDRKIDDEAVIAGLASGAGYVGAIGSRRATAARRERLLAAGLAAEQLERLSAPIGLDLGGTTPAETALSIFAEIIAARNRRAGGRLSAATGLIHGPAQHSTVSS